MLIKVSWEELVSLAEAMERATEVILRHSTDSKLPFDGPTATIDYIQDNYEHQSKTNSTNPSSNKSEPRENDIGKHIYFYCGQELQ